MGVELNRLFYNFRQLNEETSLKVSIFTIYPFVTHFIFNLYLGTLNVFIERWIEFRFLRLTLCGGPFIYKFSKKSMSSEPSENL